MIRKTFETIRIPISIGFFCLGLLTFIDYFLPKSEYNAIVNSSEISVEPSRKGGITYFYSYYIDDIYVRTTQTGYYQVYDDDTVRVMQTPILRSLYSIIKDKKDLVFLQAPNSFFPFFPFLLMITLPFQLIDSERIFILVAKPLSLTLSFIILLMISI